MCFLCEKIEKFNVKGRFLRENEVFFKLRYFVKMAPKVNVLDSPAGISINPR